MMILQARSPNQGSRKRRISDTLTSGFRCWWCPTNCVRTTTASRYSRSCPTCSCSCSESPKTARPSFLPRARYILQPTKIITISDWTDLEKKKKLKIICCRIRDWRLFEMVLYFWRVLKKVNFSLIHVWKFKNPIWIIIVYCYIILLHIWLYNVFIIRTEPRQRT